jgi:hypothetical protein
MMNGSSGVLGALRAKAREKLKGLRVRSTDVRLRLAKRQIIGLLGKMQTLTVRLSADSVRRMVRIGEILLKTEESVNKAAYDAWLRAFEAGHQAYLEHARRLAAKEVRSFVLANASLGVNRLLELIRVMAETKRTAEDLLGSCLEDGTKRAYADAVITMHRMSAAEGFQFEHAQAFVSKLGRALQVQEAKTLTERLRTKPKEEWGAEFDDFVSGKKKRSSRAPKDEPDPDSLEAILRLVLEKLAQTKGPGLSEPVLQLLWRLAVECHRILKAAGR